MQIPGVLSKPNPKIKKLCLKKFIFSAKTYTLYFEMKPDLTCYHNSLLPLKNFLYFSETKSIVHFQNRSQKTKENDFS